MTLPTWNVMPLAPGGGYIVAKDFTYRAAIRVEGSLAGLANRSSVSNYASGTLQFRQVHVWQRGDVLPVDWVSPPDADYYVQGVCGVTQTLPASTSKGVWPLNATVSVIQAVWYGIGHVDGPGVPQSPTVTAITTTSPAATFVVGGVLLVATYAAYEWWKKWKQRR